MIIQEYITDLYKITYVIFKHLKSIKKRQKGEENKRLYRYITIDDIIKK